MEVLVLNSGSTSLKFKVFLKSSEEVLCSGVYKYGKVVDFVFEIPGGESQAGFFQDKSTVLEHLFNLVGTVVEGVSSLVVLHRIVHGGTEFLEPVRLSEKVVRRLHVWGKLAPLHQSQALELVELIQTRYPAIVQLGVMDTAFHQTIEPKDYLYGLPYEVYEKYGVRKFGFHGLSHQGVYEKLGEVGEKKIERVVSVHLGGGCSVCAIKNGQSVASSMGLSPEEGLIMATRSGDVGVGAVLHMLRNGVGLEEIEDMTNRQGGLLGLSGQSEDLKYLMDNREDNRNALALDVFIERIVEEVGAMVVKLGGVDVLVFTGAIGYMSQIVRDSIIDRLGVFDITVKGGEEVGDGVWRQIDAVPSVYAIKTQEELTMLHAWKAVSEV